MTYCRDVEPLAEPVGDPFYASALTVQLSEIEETRADEAFLAMSRLRDLLVRRDANSAACRVDEAIEKLTAACREK